jgi:hypothetical protein
MLLSWHTYCFCEKDEALNPWLETGAAERFCATVLPEDMYEPDYESLLDIRHTRL